MVHHVWQAMPVMQPAKIHSKAGKVVSAPVEGFKKGLHACEVCGMGFQYASILERHMLTHTREKSHVCETCDMAFSSRFHLNRHMLTHTGEKPHVCETCGKGFAQNGNMYAHMRTHMR
jgi:hypothetical protein